VLPGAAAPYRRVLAVVERKVGDVVTRRLPERVRVALVARSSSRPRSTASSATAFAAASSRPFVSDRSGCTISRGAWRSSASRATTSRPATAAPWRVGNRDVENSRQRPRALPRQTRGSLTPREHPSSLDDGSTRVRDLPVALRRWRLLRVAARRARVPRVNDEPRPRGARRGASRARPGNLSWRLRLRAKLLLDRARRGDSRRSRRRRRSTTSGAA